MKVLAQILMVVTLLAGCQCRLSPVHLTVGVDSTQMLLIPTLPVGDSVVSSFRADSALQAELTYYLERHNVQDEGYEMIAAYAQQTDTLLSLLPVPATSLFGIGEWTNICREETVIASDTLGRIVIGTYAGDSLTQALRLDSAGIYTGDLGGSMASGHGYYLADGDVYYEGMWQDDRRHGFGFSVSPYSAVRVGEWKNDRYLGERIQYTSERIYGIDISRYQHGKGRKKYPIHWNQLRVTHLGRNQKHAMGRVDYPVSFVFIKSTESTSIKNPYYGADYLQARRYGIPIGAYHFFSCRTGGAAQAQYFMMNTRFRSGDLPPVLDVEPSASQIAAMGGTEALFRQMRAFLNTVERGIHVRPILYVSQQFVNRYLSAAPDLKRNYQVWIARYSEYKPDVKLVVWQLSPNGRVSGIHGEVDINVFNGYRTQFEDFLRTETVK